MRRFIFGATMAILAAAAQPQLAMAQDLDTLKIGPDPEAEYSLYPLSSFGSRWVQTFLIPNNAIRLISFSFWWTGSPYPTTEFFELVWVSDSPAFDTFSGTVMLDPTQGGRVTLAVDKAVIPYDTWYFSIFSNNGQNIGDDPLAALAVVPDAAYLDGSFYFVDPGESYNTGYDLLFEADFTATPEPISLALLGTGLAGLAAVRRRKRRERL